MVNTKVRLIIFSAAEDGEALYHQQKQDLELTVAYDLNGKEVQKGKDICIYIQMIHFAVH